MEENTVYREMYLTMMRAAEQAIRLLIDAQRKCEELYLEKGGEEAAESRARPN